MTPRFLRVVGRDESADPAELMARAGRGDDVAFGVLYDELAPLIFGVVLKVVRDRAMTEEVTQEVFVEMWRQAPRFDPERGNVRSWCATIAHRRAVDRVRSEQSRRDRESADELRAVRLDHDTVSEAVAGGIEAEQVRAALQELTESQREAVTLAYYGGKTYREVAVLLGIPEGTAKTRIRDALIKLRDKLGVTA